MGLQRVRHGWATEHPHTLTEYKATAAGEQLSTELRYLSLVAQLVKNPPACAGDPGLIPGSGRSAREGIGYPLQYLWASLVAQLVKSLPAMWETWVWKIPLRREQLPTPVFWSGEFHGLYSPWGRKESDTTEQLSLSLNKTLTGKKRSQEMETYLESCIQIQTVPQSTPFTFQ